MRETRRRILEALHHRNLFTESLGRDALSVLGKNLAPDQFIQKVSEESRSEDCLRCNGQPYCSLFLAVAHLERGALLEARSQIEQAIAGFWMRGSQWNQAMCQWMLGTVLLEENNDEPAKRSLQKALEILHPLLREYRSESNYRQAGECTEHIQELEKMITGLSRRLKEKNAPESHVADGSGPDAEHVAYLAIPWIPVYAHVEVEAGLSQSSWVEQEIKQKSELAEIYIDGTCYLVHPVRQLTAHVTLSPGKQYGWVKVHGKSMDAAQPTRIDEGDYALFYESGWPNGNEIVIVSRADSPAVEDGYSYMIKRYSERNQELTSETSMQGDNYRPVSIFEGYQCMGVVVAVAKRKN